ncbi:hypothetical protein N8T08_008424 [Aspergillus melleus]|uniref:Uncharacterized protein n=1 Tax=Aspergillus melleus TaxID=138277 RepID=A0ACC3AW93_9EURO|nr:hypothetical protein N8T08_008424 [Aspergillus melleus]
MPHASRPYLRQPSIKPIIGHAASYLGVEFHGGRLRAAAASQSRHGYAQIPTFKPVVVLSTVCSTLEVHNRNAAKSNRYLSLLCRMRVDQNGVSPLLSAMEVRRQEH